ncbi:MULTISPECIES: hypothetical protein [Aliivibrio]|uniref:Uncharacterized protein n=1 Tax=Aliivibrio logei 5S-186 TaxID=626086 RepID=A0ABX3AZ28_ALILO|nr:hypothetical protein [Aliivibrio logei]OEF18985.1 hypothetical protein A1Q5_18670 [Aliivibrio logei 5S-186]
MEYYDEIVELLGGITVVLAALFAFISKIWLSRIIEHNKNKLMLKLKKVEHELGIANKRLDAQLQHSVFVSQVQFDKEYRIYGEVWECLVELKIATGNLRPWMDKTDPQQSEKERILERYNAFITPFNNFSMALEKNKPFFSKKVYQALSDVRNECDNESIDYKYGKSTDKNYYECAVQNSRKIAELIDLSCDVIRTRLNEVRVQ